MDFLLEALTNWLKEMLVGGIMSNLSGMFDSVNQQVADISVQVGQTPQGWNGNIFSMIENLSNSIMVPIAGVILAIVMTVDLIQMIADKNNLHDVDTWMIFKWVFKSAAAILIVTNTWNGRPDSGRNRSEDPVRCGGTVLCLPVRLYVQRSGGNGHLCRAALHDVLPHAGGMV